MEFKKYNHSKEEKKISDFWIKKGLFKPKKNKSNKKFSIVIPPPNVTGRLHMGHALNNSLQDVLVRFNRIKGHETLWQPGTDHAGIATQAVVENNLLKEGIKKNDLGREKFIKKIWDWKEESGGIILDQLKKLGCSCDWSRTRFTMDKDLSKAVIKVFVDLLIELLFKSANSIKKFVIEGIDTKLLFLISLFLNIIFFELNNFISLLSFKRIYFFMEEFLLSIHLSRKSISFKAFRKSELNPTSTTLNFDLK